MDEVHWTHPALQDLDDIGAYIALDDPKATATLVPRASTILLSI
jgi:plasmid stabilization system protein ParE